MPELLVPAVFFEVAGTSVEHGQGRLRGRS